jgi:hypothetical protein
VSTTVRFVTNFIVPPCTFAVTFLHVSIGQIITLRDTNVERFWNERATCHRDQDCITNTDHFWQEYRTQKHQRQRTRTQSEPPMQRPPLPPSKV